MNESSLAPTDGADTRRGRILQAAERVFAREGYHGTTLRTIATSADVKLSLLVYHFDTKLSLYRAVFDRRQYVNDQRLELLRSVDVASPDAIDSLVSAFLDPVLRLHDDPADIWFARLALREASDPSSQQRGIIRDLFDPMAREFIETIRRVNPGHEPGFYTWSYLFAVGALTSSAFDGRAVDLGQDDETTASPPGDSKAATLRTFIAAGWGARSPGRE
ncbi:MAG: TetR/AcrR family transcriptional regulator [Mycobacterium sp.]